jgi:hypothetical protein
MFVEDLEGRTLMSANVISTPPIVTRPVAAPPQGTPPSIAMPVVVTLPAAAKIATPGRH